MIVPAIRLATAADLDGLLGMVHGLARHHGDAPLATMDSLRGDLFGPVAWFHALVADDGAQCVGYAALLPLARLHLGQRGMDLHHLFVDQSVRSRGIGRALVKASKDHARALGCSYFTIGTSADNAAAHQFYLHLGFSDKPLEGRRFSMDLNAAAATIAP